HGINRKWRLNRDAIFYDFRTGISKPNNRFYFAHFIAQFEFMSGLFLSCMESKTGLSEHGKLRRIEEITRANLGQVKMEGEDKNKPWVFCLLFLLRKRVKSA
ncbi:MAG: hypothetical protein ACOCVA_09105, partial [Prolixibacteraceae bacterium]